MMRRLVLLACSVLLLAGCTKYYYTHPEKRMIGFHEDSRACIRDVGTLSGNGQYARVSREPYQRCMLARGWIRQEKVEPADEGWYRGVEDDVVVDLRAGIPQPARDDNDSTQRLFCRRRANQSGRDRWAENYWRCMAGY